MKILVVCQYYWPEPYPLQDICEELVRRGHEVQVVAGVPNYPMGRIYPAYRQGRNRTQCHNGVRIRRTFTIGRRNSRLFRILNYFSFALSSTLYINRLPGDFDVVFTQQGSPIMMVWGALAYGRKHGKKTVVYSMDLWPASLAAGGIREGSAVWRIFERISGDIYRDADRLLISSEAFRAYLTDRFGIDGGRIRYLPQYAKLCMDMPASGEKDTVDLMFAGNIGAAQSIPTILKAARRLADRQELRWHIVGDGSELERCRKLARQLGLSNVVFHGRRDAEEMPEYFSMADAMLVTMTADPTLCLTLPGKVQCYLAAGKPLIGAANGATAEVIAAADCGFRAEAEDDAGLAAAVLDFLNCPDKVRLGENARNYYLAHFSRRRFMDALEEELARACEDGA